MKARSLTRRRLANSLISLFSGVCATAGVVVLMWIIYEVVARGAGAISWSFFTELPTPPGMTGGGLANAMVGTLLMTLLATLMGVPVGLFTGVYLAEFSHQSMFSLGVRFTANVLMGMPSIIIGLFVYTLLVVTTGHFSGYAGATALAIIMFPVVARTTEDMLGLVPNSLREAALALGTPRWKVTLGIVFRAAKSGLLTGVLLAIGRVSGETAPLLFTALNSPFWTLSLDKPTANLTVSIFNYAMSPYRDWQQMAWGASLVIMAAVLLLTVMARVAIMERKPSPMGKSKG
jgi:phosphate transport system permease protein